MNGKVKSEQFKKSWTMEKAPLNWIEMIYEGDTRKMKKIFGFQFNGHYYISRNQITTCYINQKTERIAEKFGAKKYSNLRFIKDLLRISKEAENKLKIFFQRNTVRALSKKNNQELFKLFFQFFNNYSVLIGIYRFTRRTFYTQTIENIKKSLPEPQEENINLLLQGNLENINFNSKLKIKKLVDLLRQVGERRFAMHAIYQNIFIQSGQLYEEIGRRLGLSIIEARNCSSRELKDYLLNKKPINVEEIKNRIKYFKFIYHNDSFKIITKLEKGSMDRFKTKELSGQVANSGKVKGKTKVFRDSLGGILISDMQKMNKGDILVATSTSPDMMPAVKKASAIITDIGGMLCHAAIISRELNIPCIIDIKIATQVLKDGDLVEVDANKGIVRILK